MSSRRCRTTNSEMGSVMRFLLFFLAFSVLVCSTPSSAYERLQPVSQGLSAPTAVAVDSSARLYVVESSRNRLAAMDRDGTLLSQFAGLDKPISVAVDGQGRVLVGNMGRGDVEVFDENLQPLFKLGQGLHEFVKPTAIGTDFQGRIYVSDSGKDQISVYDAKGRTLYSFGVSGSGDGQLRSPSSLAVNATANELYVADFPITVGRDGVTEGARVQVFNTAGVYKRNLASYGQGEGLLIRPLGLATDGSAVYVSDAYQNVVQVLDRAGDFLEVVYDLGNPLRTPLGVSVGKNGRLYVASLNTGTVEVYDLEENQ